MPTPLEYMQFATGVYAASPLNKIDPPVGWTRIDLMDWYIQAGSQAMSATADVQRAFMLGGVGDDNLTARSLADVLVGNAENDLLYGNSFDRGVA